MPERPMAAATTPRPLRVLVAPDSFKGTFSSVVVARALAEGWQATRPGDDVVLTPMADGGEGLLEAVAASGGWQRLPAGRQGPPDANADSRLPSR